VIAFQHKKCTLLELVEKYISTKTGVRPTTKAGYKTVINFLSKDPFGRKRIDTVRLSDAKCWLIKLQADGKSYSSIHSLRGVLRPAFKMAVDDDLILKNPFGFQLVGVVLNDSHQDACRNKETSHHGRCGGDVQGNHPRQIQAEGREDGGRLFRVPLS